MCTHTEGLLHPFPTVAARLSGEARVDSDHLMSSILSLGFKDVEERAPTGVQDGFRQMTILDHVGDSQSFHHNTLIAFGISFSRLEMMIATLAIDLQMVLATVPPASASLDPFFSPAQLALFRRRVFCEVR